MNKSSDALDLRIVELRFDNQQFESATKESMSTLDKLKNQLKFEESGKGLENLGKSITVSSESLSKMASNVEDLHKRFSTMGIVGATIIQNLTNGVLGFIKSIPSKLLGFDPLGQIITGGKKRALNIAQAKFQLKGLGIAIEEVEGSINEAVNDTAYGYDSAAKAASQLAASNVALGEDMTHALRGISGVAAMTNSEYDEIANIFVKVAGNGRLMGQELNQISARGLNVAATLADYLDKTGKLAGATEAEVRELVSKGAIDFQLFADAMDDAFGAHAKDAQKTFTGALSNVKAACSRIGEKFFTPLTNNAIDALGKLRDRFNDLLKGVKDSEGNLRHVALLQPIFDDWAKSTERWGKALADWLDGLDLRWIYKFAQALVFVKDGLAGIAITAVEAWKKVFPTSLSKPLYKFASDVASFALKFKNAWGRAVEFVKPVTDEVEKVDNAAKKVSHTVEEIEAMAKRVIRGEFGNGYARKKNLAEIGYSWAQVQNVVNEMLDCSVRHTEAEDLEIEATKELSKETQTLGDKQYELSEITYKSTSRTDKLRTIFTGLATVVKVLRDVLGAIFTKVIKPLITKAIPKIIDALFEIVLAVANFILVIRDIIVDSRLLDVVFSGIVGVFWLVGLAISKVAEGFAYLTRNGERTRRIAEILSNAFEKFKGVIASVYDGFKKFVDNIKNIPGVVHLIESLKAVRDIVADWLDKKIEFLLDKFSQFVEKIGGVDFSTGEFSGLAKVIDTLAESLAKLIDIVKDGPEDILGAFGVVPESIKDVFRFITSIPEAVRAAQKAGVYMDKDVYGVFTLISTFFNKIFNRDVIQTTIDIFRQSAMSAFDKFLADLRFRVDNLKQLGEEGAEAIKAFVTTFAQKLSEGGKSLSDWLGLDKIKPQDITNMLAIADALYMMAGAGRMLFSIASMNKKIGGVADSLSAFFKSWKKGHKETKAESFFIIAAGILALAGALWVISGIPANDLKRSVAVLAGMFVVITALSGVMGLLQSKKIIDLQEFGRTMALVGVGLLAIAAAAKVIETIDDASLKKAISVIAGVLFIVAIANRLSGRTSGLARTFLGIAIALYILLPAISLMSKINWATVVDGSEKVGVMLIALGAACRLAGQGGAGRTMLAMAIAIFLLVPSLLLLTKLDWHKVAIAIAEIAALMFALAGAAKLSHVGFGGTQGVDTLRTMVVAILAIAISLYVLTKMDQEALLRSAVALGGVILAVGIASALINRYSGGFWKAIGNALAIGLMIGAVTAAFTLLHKFNADEDLLEKAAAISLVLAVVTGIIVILGSIRVGISGAIQAALAVAGFIGVLGGIAIGIGELIVCLEKIGFDVEAVMNKAIMFVSKVGELIGAFFGGIKSGYDETAFAGLEDKIKDLTDFMKHVPEFASYCKGINVSDFANVPELIKAIDQFDEIAKNVKGNKTRFKSLGRILEIIGESITKLYDSLADVKTYRLGQLVNAIATISDSLTALASIQFSKLSFFESETTTLANGLFNFYDNVKRIKVPEIIDNVVKHALTPLTDIFPKAASASTISAAGVKSFSEGLSALSTGLYEFYTGVKRIHAPEIIGYVAEKAIKPLADVAKEIPNSGGLLGRLVGNNDVDEWGSQLKFLAWGLNDFARITAGQDYSHVDGVIFGALRPLVGFSKEIPNSGGKLGDLVGNNDADIWGPQLKFLAWGVNDFAQITAGQDYSHIPAVIDGALRPLSDFGKELENQGGVLGYWVGENDAGTFGNSLSVLGEGLKNFAEKTAGLADNSDVSSSINYINSIGGVLKAAVEGDWYTGITNFDFALGDLADNLSNFAIAISGTAWSDFDIAIAQIKKLVDFMADASTSLQSSVSAFKTALQDIANSGIDAFINAFEGAYERSYKAGQQLINSAIRGAKSVYVYGTFWKIGYNAGEGFYNGMKSWAKRIADKAYDMVRDAVNAAKKAEDSHSPSKEFFKVGAYGGMGLVLGFESQASDVNKAAAGLAKSALSSVKDTISSIGDVLDTGVEEPSIRPVLDLSNIQNGQSTIGGLLNDRTMQLAGQASVSLSTDKVSFEETLAKTVESAITRAMDNFKEHEDLQPYEIVVPINYNGREVSRVTAPFIRADLNKRDMHELRKVGVV